MSQFPHDQFAKNLLESLLSPYGQVKTALTLNSEVREIDVYFTPNANLSATSDLGLLAQCAANSAAFEPFRNPVTALEIRSCMSKLYDLHLEIIRQARREKQQKIADEDLPWLWIFTPTLAAPTLLGFGAINEVESWGSGVYLLPPLQKTGIIVIHQLPATPQTLWLRLLGKGKVQSQAITEVGALPADSPYRANALELFSNLRVILEAKQNMEPEERELIMQLSPLYLEKIREAEERGIEQGELRGQVEGKLALVVRLLARRLKVEQLPSDLLLQIQSLPLVKLEELGEALLDFQQMANLMVWLTNNHPQI
ncbi:MAG: DUF4351 domain-containing protein [Gloeotrichia echinulata IR180]|jgi:hypothetical protein